MAIRADLPLNDAETSAGANIIVLNAMSGARITVPGGGFLLTADYSREGSDLVLAGEDGGTVVVRGYFAQQEPPSLVTENGAEVSPDLVATLAGPVAPGQYAQAGAPSAAEALGSVVQAEGDAFAIRADGTRVPLSDGDPVFLGDVLQTGGGAALKVRFSDGTRFSLSESARMTVDELVYDPGANQGSALFSVLQGTFSFVSGAAAKTAPDAMVIRTPVASIGIRGTVLLIKIDLSGEVLSVSLIGDTGAVQLFANAAPVGDLLDVAGATMTFAPGISPVQSVLTDEQLESIYGAEALEEAQAAAAAQIDPAAGGQLAQVTAFVVTNDGGLTADQGQPNNIGSLEPQILNFDIVRLARVNHDETVTLETVTLETVSLEEEGITLPTVSGGRTVVVDADANSPVHQLVGLPEFPAEVLSGGSADPEDINGVDMRNLTLENTQQATVTFVQEGAGFQNSFGWYQIGSDGEIQSPEIIWANISAAESGGDLEPGVSTKSLGTLPPGTQVGFFLIGDGYSNLSDLDLADGHFEFRDIATGDPATIFDAAAEMQLVFISSDGTEVVVGDPIYHTAASAALGNLALNADGVQHSLSGTGGGGLIIGFEDRFGGGDQDYNDITIRVNFDPQPDDGLPAGAGAGVLIAATVQIDGSVGILSGASVAIAGGSLQAGDTLYVSGIAALNNAGVAADFDDATGVLAFTGLASAEAYETLLQSVAFYNADTSKVGTRSLEFSLADENGVEGPAQAISVVVQEGPELTGTGSADLIVGDKSDNSIDAGGGDDVLVGGLGADDMSGGAGADSFQYMSLFESGDLISDFNSVQGDKLVFYSDAFGGIADVVEGANFIVIGGTYDGTLGGDAPTSWLNGEGTFIVDGDGNLHYDSNGGSDGYTTVAEVQGTVVSADDFQMV